MHLGLAARRSYHRSTFETPTDTGKRVSDRISRQSHLWTAAGNLDISKMGNGRATRNEVYEGSNFAFRREEWHWPGDGTVSFDYVSWHRPRATARPVEGDVWRDLLAAVHQAVFWPAEPSAEFMGRTSSRMGRTSSHAIGRTGSAAAKLDEAASSMTCILMSARLAAMDLSRRARTVCLRAIRSAHHSSRFIAPKLDIASSTPHFTYSICMIYCP